VDIGESLVVPVEPIPVFIVVQAHHVEGPAHAQDQPDRQMFLIRLPDKTGQWNKASPRHVYDYVDACIRDEPRDASAMHRHFGIFGNSAVNTSRGCPRASPTGMTMKRLRMVLACLVCLGMAVVSGSAAAGDMNQGGNGASGSSTNSSGGGY
jgi:hypothetical protein